MQSWSQLLFKKGTVFKNKVARNSSFLELFDKPEYIDLKIIKSANQH